MELDLKGDFFRRSLFLQCFRNGGSREITSLCKSTGVWSRLQIDYAHMRSDLQFLGV